VLGRSSRASGGAGVVAARDRHSIKALRSSINLFRRDPGSALARSVRLTRVGLRARLAVAVIIEADRAVVVRREGLPQEVWFARKRPPSEDLWRRTSEGSEPTAVEDLRESEPEHFESWAPLKALSYLGVALRTGEGVGIGAICAIDCRTRKWSKEDLALLEGIAESAAAEIELQRALHEKNLAARDESELHGVPDSDARFRQLLDANLVGIIFGDAGEVITGSNQTFLQMMGYSRGDLAAGKLRWQEITPPEYRELDQNAREDSLTRGASKPYEKEYLRKDGSRVPVLVAPALLDQRGQRWVSLVVDLTDVIQVRDEFLSIASHELKTPLTPLRLLLQSTLRTLRSQGEPPSRQSVAQKLDKAARQVDRITRLIDDLLVVSRITAGRLTLATEKVDLAEVAREVVERFRLESTVAGSSIQLRTAAAEGEWDRVRIEQIIASLLTNAIRYGAGRPIQLKVECRERTAILQIVDHGIGISAEATEHIFERFQRSSSPTAPHGLGLGLYLTHQIVRAHGGAIHVRSQPGAGSTFTVELPRFPAS